MVRSFSMRDGQLASIDCTDWEDFRRCIRDVLKANAGGSAISDRYLFRGQSCAKWLLQPSFDRANSSLSPVERDRKYEQQMRLFRENYSVFGNIGKSQFSDEFEDISKITPEEIEGIAQHYGLSTRLLDWSLSVYVAAFFAFSRVDLCQSGKVSIWSLDRKVLEHFSKSEIVVTRDLYRGNVRNLWQMGMFVRNYTSNSDVTELFRQNSRSYDHKLDTGPPSLIRFDFPAACEIDVLDDLQMMRINSMTIFPGIEGVVKWIQRRIGIQ